MPNTTVPAAAEGVPNTDPLLDAIDVYQKGWAAFRETPDNKSDQFVYLWAVPYDVLRNWSSACTTRTAALAALELAIEEEATGDSPLVEPLLKSALSYFQNEESDGTKPVATSFDKRAINAIDACCFSVMALVTLLEAVDDQVSDITFAGHSEHGQKVITDAQNMTIVAVRFAKSIVADIEAVREGAEA